MATRASIWTALAPALVIGGVVAAPGGLDLQQGLWVQTFEAYAHDPRGGDPGRGGPGDGRGGGVGGRSGAEQDSASAAGHDARHARGAQGGRESREFSVQGKVSEVARESAGDQALALARERYNRALGVTAQVSVAAKAMPGQGLVTDEAVVVIPTDTAEPAFFFEDEATEALIRARWAAPQVRSDRALPEHGQSDGPGRGPAGDWQDVNLDLNGDGIVDEHDLALARQRQAAR